MGTISILSGLSKLVKYILAVYFKNHLNIISLLPPVQWRFRSGYSYMTTLLDVTNEIIQWTDQNEATVLLLLDFSNAFDTINHRNLLLILKSMGFCPEIYHLVDSYLSNTSWVFKLMNRFSSVRDILCGVPQGSVLGRLTFTIYTSQFTKNMKYSFIHMYAHDTQLYRSFPFNCKKQAFTR